MWYDSTSWTHRIRPWEHLRFSWMPSRRLSYIFVGSASRKPTRPSQWRCEKEPVMAPAEKGEELRLWNMFRPFSITKASSPGKKTSPESQPRLWNSIAPIVDHFGFLVSFKKKQKLVNKGQGIKDVDWESWSHVGWLEARGKSLFH